MKQIEGAAGYAVPFLHSGLEIDPFETLLLQTAMQRAGIMNTKSGTWIREMAKRSMPGTSLMSKMAFRKHEAALREVGLVDAHDKPTWFNEEGKPDLIKMLDIAGEHLAKIPLTRRAGLEQALWGTQGAGAAATLSDPTVRGQVKALREEMNKVKVDEQFFSQFAANSPAQQFRTAWGETTNVLMDIGTVVLPPLTDGLRLFRDALAGLKEYLPKPGTHGDAVGKGALIGTIVGGGVGFMFGGLGVVPGMALGGFLGGAIGGGNWAKQNYPLAAWPSAAAPPVIGTGLQGSGIAANQQRAATASQNIQISVKAETDNPDGLAQQR